MPLQDAILDLLACPIDHLPLQRGTGDVLACFAGHRFPVVEGVPVLLVEDFDPTHPYCAETLAAARTPLPQPPALQGADAVDPFVQDEIIKTNGNLYRHLKGRLPRYPIPEIRLPPGDGALLLDVGCNWGRWTLAAGQNHYRAVGLDPSLEACLAGRRVSRQLGLDVAFIVGDARALPFADGVLDRVFSYSVLQHFDRSVARQAVSEMGRVLRPGGGLLVQMPNLFGARQLFNRLRQALRREAGLFRVRYWTPHGLATTFSRLVGPSRLKVDGFFSLNPQTTDLDLLTPFNRLVVKTSDRLRRLSDTIRCLAWFADSLYVDATKALNSPPEPLGRLPGSALSRSTSTDSTKDHA